MTPAVRQVVIVTGAPGSGKTTLARPLAAELGFALLAKDRIKETLHDILGSTGADLAWSTRTTLPVDVCELAVQVRAKLAASEIRWLKCF